MSRARDLADTGSKANFLDNVTANIPADVQSELDAKLSTSTASSTYAPLNSPAFTGTVTGISVSKSEVGLANVTNHAQFHSGNDGTGSGLDADLLDGQEGSYYQPSSSALTTSTTFAGDVSGTSGAMVVADDSHNHVVSNIDGLSTTLNAVKPSISSIGGAIVPGASSTILINGSCFDTTNVSVEYKEGSTLLATVTGVTPTSSGIISTATPSQVYNQSAGDTISIRVFNNGDTSVASNTVTKQVGLPTGGTRSNPTGSTYQHIFTSSGTFSTDLTNLSIEYVIVAGGGGGGIGYSGGGGGGGGFRSNVSGQTSGGGAGAEGSMTLTGGDYQVIIGSGGSSTANGADSSFNGKTSLGGGGGGSFPSAHDGRDGGSGGGACDKNSSTQNGGVGATGQGKNGGTCSTSGSPFSGGGGGGSSQAGTNGGPNTGNGGNGQSTSLTNATYAGGGGGGIDTNNQGGTSGGTGGGGAGSLGSSSPTAGSPNTGGGGGGGNPNNVQGASGGSGIVILRYTL